MKIFTRSMNIFLALCLTLGALALAPTQPAQAESQPLTNGQSSTKGLSPQGFLNEDGTLRTDTNLQGTFDLDGWNVQLDPLHGPVFTPQAALDNWAGVGSSGNAFNESINAIAVNGTDVYVGGIFQNAGGVAEADYIAMWDGTEWTSLSNGGSGTAALTGSPVNALLFVGSNLYVGGGFAVRDTSGDVIPNTFRLAMWNGSAWSAVPGITENLNNRVSALAHDSLNNILYVGGEFTNANGDTEADHVFGIDLDDNSLVKLGNNDASEGSINAWVLALAVASNGDVYAGGFFQNVNNKGTVINEADRIAKWDGNDWSALGNNGPGNGALNQPVGAIAIDASDNVYVGGSFWDAAGIATADYIAKWNGSAWSALGSNGLGNGALLQASGGTVVQEIVIDGSDIYVGGFFTGASVTEADYAARFDTGTNTWHSLGSNGAGNGSLNNGVIDMAYANGNLYLGGYFTNVNDNNTIVGGSNYFAIWDSNYGWSALGNYTDGVISNPVNAIAAIGTDVYVGGNFINLDGNTNIDYLARWDGLEWHPVGNLTQVNGSLNGSVHALTVDGTDLYVGGTFTTASNEGSGLTVNRVAKWDGSTWSAMGSGVGAFVRALAVDANHNVYVGGDFTDADSIPEADYIAKWDGANWSALGVNGGALNNIVFALAVKGTDLYVGGAFTSVKNTSNVSIPNTAYLAKWNGSAWSAMDGITSPLNDEVYALTVAGGSLYVGGRFFNLNGLDTADRLAKWDGATWSALGSNGNGGGAVTSYVKAIAVSGNRVYIGGVFQNINNGGQTVTAGDYVAQWDGVNWSSLGDDGSNQGSLSNMVNALKIVDNDLWVGGNFENVNNGGTVLQAADFIATYGIDDTPQVALIARGHANPTARTSVDFHVYFSKPVTGVDEIDFTLGVAPTGASITGVSGSGDTYTVTVNTGTGNGTLRLDLLDNDTIVDSNSISLGGNGAGNGNFTGGQSYTVQKSTTFQSTAAQDGWVLESTETSGVGGTLNKGGKTLLIGDDASNRQYRAILSFATASLPDDANIAKVTLKVRRKGVVGGGNPITAFGGFMVDIKKGNFNTSSLQLADFSTKGTKTYGTFKPKLVGGWYTINLTKGKLQINKLGNTQIRLRFKLDDNNDFVANFLSIHSGNASSASRPQLIVEYDVPVP